MNQRTTDSDIGERLRRNIGRLLLVRGWSHPDLYHRVGMTRSGWAQIFKQPNGPTVATLDRIATELGTTADALLRDESPDGGGA